MIEKSKIYTRSGDGGNTSLFGGRCIPKDDPIAEALGTLDECNSAIGMALSLLQERPPFSQQLPAIQKDLIAISAEIAGATPPPFSESQTLKELESWIDALDSELPPLKEFIHPGGTPPAAALHLARTFCRRAERRVWELHKEKILPQPLLSYLNRLSDYLFVAARYANRK